MGNELSNHVSYHLVIRSYPGRPELGGDYDAYVPNDLEGREELEKAGYRPVEIVTTDERGESVVEVRYLQSSGDIYEPGDYEKYRSLLYAQEQQAAQDAAARMNELAGPRAQGRPAQAQKAIVSAIVVPLSVVAGENDDRDPPEFQVKTISPTAAYNARKDADALLRSQGLVPGNFPGDPNTYYMSELQWQAHQRAEERAVADSIYTD